VKLGLSHDGKNTEFDNRALMRPFGPKRVELAGCWRRLHNEELHKFYALPNIINVIK
jgi:hypothetical protein